MTAKIKLWLSRLFPARIQKPERPPLDTKLICLHIATVTPVRR